jgi:hypothetical protein
MRVQRLLTRRGDASEHRIDAVDLDDTALPPGQLQLAVSRVAITTNNITYALFGDQMHYWQFFPSGQPDWGIVPVWGFADVVASAVPDIAAGERIYGYLPLAEQLRVLPARVTAEGFVDASAHRAGLPAIYNRYVRCTADADYRRDDEDALMIVRPLFTTAYLLSDFLREHTFFGATQVVLSSASSKTAYATAWSLKQPPGGIDVVGLTSDANRDFVRSLGCYDRVLGYDEVASLDPATPSVYADFSGSAAQRARLHGHFGDALRHSAVIGATQFSVGPKDSPLPGAKPTFFFAPDQVRRCIEAWGPADFQRRLVGSQRRFLARALQADDPWLRIERHRGLDSAAALMAQMAQGRVDPRMGHALVVDASR